MAKENTQYCLQSDLEIRLGLMGLVDHQLTFSEIGDLRKLMIVQIISSLIFSLNEAIESGSSEKQLEELAKITSQLDLARNHPVQFMPQAEEYFRFKDEQKSLTPKPLWFAKPLSNP